MVKKKKRVPEWLNSSIWSSTNEQQPISSRHVYHYSPETSPTRQALPDPKPDPHPPPHISVVSDSPSLSITSAAAVEDLSRQALLFQELSRKIIEIGEVRKLASQGIPEGAGIRSTVWKLLLGYLPVDRGIWPSELAKKRSQYKHFKDDLLMNPMCFCLNWLVNRGIFLMLVSTEYGVFLKKHAF